MNAWTYSDYISAVKGDISFCTDMRGYSLEEAIGFAHSELTLRLEESPVEAPLALVALARSAIDAGIFGSYTSDDDFIVELSTALEDSRVGGALQMLNPEQRSAFSGDVALVKREIAKM